MSFEIPESRPIDDSQPLFSEGDELVMGELRDSIRDRVHYDFRQIIGIADRVRKKTYTGEVNEYGDPVEDWSQVPSSVMVDALAAACVWEFLSVPVYMNAHIESSLADVIYRDEYNRVLTSPDIEGTVQVKASKAELATSEQEFAKTYRNLYTNYAKHVINAFGVFVKRLESIVWMRSKEAELNPFSSSENSSKDKDDD